MAFLRNLTYPVVSYTKKHSPVGTTLADSLQLESGRGLYRPDVSTTGNSLFCYESHSSVENTNTIKNDSIKPSDSEFLLNNI